MDDRRHSPRRLADWRVEFGPPGALVRGFLADLSPMGVSILSETQYPVGTEIEVHFWLPEEYEAESFLIRAIVRHSTGRRIGAQFVDPEFPQRERLWKIMRGVP